MFIRNGSSQLLLNSKSPGPEFSLKNQESNYHFKYLNKLFLEIYPKIPLVKRCVKFSDRTTNIVDPDHYSSLIWVYTFLLRAICLKHLG